MLKRFENYDTPELKNLVPYHNEKGTSDISNNINNITHLISSKYVISNDVYQNDVAGINEFGDMVNLWVKNNKWFVNIGFVKQHGNKYNLIIFYNKKYDSMDSELKTTIHNIKEVRENGYDIEIPVNCIAMFEDMTKPEIFEIIENVYFRLLQYTDNKSPLEKLYVSN